MEKRNVLITGASGLIGSALALALAKRHRVTCLSRRDPGLDLTSVQGDFAAFEDLRRLDDHPVDTVVHLGAVTGGCSEREGVQVNLEGTRCLMRYLIDRGCRRFVMASSIAVTGLQHTAFRPRQLPIEDEHPCLDRDGYGFSKYLMEEVTRYYHRQVPELEVLNLRLCVVLPDSSLPTPLGRSALAEWALGTISLMALSDAVHAFTLAVEKAYQPGLHILNTAPERAWVAEPMPAILGHWWGSDVDLSHYEQEGHAYDSAFSVDRVFEQLGFRARVLP